MHDWYSNDEQGAAAFEDAYGPDYPDDTPTRAELKADDAEAAREDAWRSRRDWS